MSIRVLPVLAALSLTVWTAAGQTSAAPPQHPAPEIGIPDDPSSLLGLSPKAAWERFGAPDRILPVRGDEPWQDDIAFEYARGYTFFWFRDYLWQIRLDERYSGSCLGIFPGDTPEKALSLLGSPERTSETYLEWRLPGKGYPIRLRLLTDGGAISEIYVYRSDF